MLHFWYAERDYSINNNNHNHNNNPNSPHNNNHNPHNHNIHINNNNNNNHHNNYILFDGSAEQNSFEIVINPDSQLDDSMDTFVTRAPVSATARASSTVANALASAALDTLIDFNLSSSSSSSPYCLEQNRLDAASIRFLLQLTNRILQVYPWVILVTASISNIISFLVLTSKKMRKSSTFFYLSCLCVIDFVSVYTFCINLIFLYQFNIDLQMVSTLFCKLFSFLIYFLPQLSAWTVAAVSFDRVVGVLFSVRGRQAAAAKRFTTPRIAFRVMLTITLCLFLLNLQFFFYPNGYEPAADIAADIASDVIDPNARIQDLNIIYCSPEHIPHLQHFYAFWVYIDLSVNVLIPFAIMIICSVIIVFGLVNMSKSMATSSHAPPPPAAAATEAKRPSTSGDKTAMLNKPAGGSAPRRPTTAKSGSSSKARNVSSMLATNNLVFITLSLPIVVFLSVAPPFDDTPENKEPICNLTKARLRLVKIIFIILMNTNYSINLIIYSLMSSQFRLQLNALFSPLFNRNPHPAHPQTRVTNDF